MSGDRRPLEPIATPLRNALRQLGLAEIETLLELLQDWDRIAGQPWAGVSAPAKLSSGHLVVRAESAASVRLLRYASGRLIQTLDERLGEGTVVSIEVVLPEA